MTGQWMRSPNLSFNGFYNMTADCPSYASQGDCANPGHWAAAGVPAVFPLASHVLLCFALQCIACLLYSATWESSSDVSLYFVCAKHH